MAAVGPLPAGSLAVFGGAAALGLIHGAEPGHGWPVAAAYALDRRDRWRHGLLASVLLGLGHLVSSLAVVAAFLLAKTTLALDRLDAPLVLLGTPIGSRVDVVAGVLLVGLGVREYRYRGAPLADGRHHREAEPDGEPAGWRDRLRSRLPFVGGHDHLAPADLDRTGLAGIVWTAFVLGFAHEEEFEIIGLCLGSSVCLELMAVYAVAVMVALVGLTTLLIAGYDRFEDRMTRYAAHLPTVSAAVLVGMGLGFVLGLL